MSDYAIPYQRRSKKDLRRKRRDRVYKRGGSFRGIDLSKKSDEPNNQPNKSNDGKK